ncbi:MAG: CvpA family protein [Desulfobulbaceae bacterium]|jgi:membrane protein required for colicin V production|nr:CvpA family protein [Desulfobulbaceae bacterium]MDY0350025.1 CvpA family protein [Desulfobulbaceae bacterium]
MISLSDITSFDVIVVLLFLLFLLRGTWIGFMRQLAAFTALIGGYLLAGGYTDQMMPVLDAFIGSPKTVFLIVFFLLFILGSIFLFLLGKVLHLVMEVTLAGWFDRLLGLLLGGVKGMLVASFLYMVLSSSLISANDLLQQSVTSGFLAHGGEFVRSNIHDPQLRALFLPREPAIKPDPEGPPAGDSARPAGPGEEGLADENG